MEYDAYLREFPDDIPVLIEKCKFIQFALYDEEEDYNPKQEEFDSCSADLSRRFPDNPKVLLFQTTYLWGDELKEVLGIAEKAIAENPDEWSKEEMASIYKSKSDQFYNDSDYKSAYLWISNAIKNDETYKTSLDYARILIELNRNKEALDVLLDNQDSSTWLLSQKADLLVNLKAYSDAVDVYNKIREKDSTYLDNSELAASFEGIGKYDLARKYLLADTSQYWNKENAIWSLLKHDLKYEDGVTCLSTYNKFRDLGYLFDPIGFYRLKLFFSHPILPWKFRDILAILTLALVTLLLIAIPYAWILPVYFVSSRFRFVRNINPYETPWRLKMFWLASSGFLIASLISSFVFPEVLYSLVNSAYQNVEIPTDSRGLGSLIFMIIMALIGFVTLFRVKLNVLLSDSWTLRRSILMAFGALFIFKLIAGIYVMIGVKQFGISVDDLARVQQILLASKQEINDLVSTFGKGTTLLFVGFIVPFYEEVIFRGVILDSCQRYLNFNLANIFQATLFAAIHQSLVLFPVFLLFGLVVGVMRKKSGGLLPGLVFHMVNNITAIIILFSKI